MSVVDWHVRCVVADAGAPGVLARVSRIIAERGLIITALEAQPDAEAPYISIKLSASERSCQWLQRRLALESGIVAVSIEAR